MSVASVIRRFRACVGSRELFALEVPEPEAVAKLGRKCIPESLRVVADWLGRA